MMFNRFGRSGRNSIRELTLSGCAVVALTWAAPALAQSAQNPQSVEFQIPAQSLASALSEYARQSGEQLLFAPDLVVGKTANAVAGDFTTSAALEGLLAGSGLAYSRTESGTVLISQAGDDRPQLRTRLAQAETDETQVRRIRRGDALEGDGERSVDRIIVTGTNIRGIAPESSPTRVFDREDIQISGVATAQDFIQLLPQNFGGGSNADIPGDRKSVV